MGSAKGGKETIETCSESLLKPWELKGYRAAEDRATETL